MTTEPTSDMLLSPHFTFGEMVHSDYAAAHSIDNTPPSAFIPRLIETANLLERIRERLGHPVIISSGYRCERLNAAVGGQRNSDHLYGRAADIECPGYGTPYMVARFLAPLVDDLGIGQLAYEGVGGKRWVHISTNEVLLAINRVITISDNGTQSGIQEVKA